MPLYCFSSEKGDVIEEFFPFGKAPRQLEVNGISYERDFQAEHNPRGAGGDSWPLACEASAVAPFQAQELRDYYKKAGVQTDVDIKGRPIYRDANHRKRALKCRGLCDRDSYN